MVQQFYEPCPKCNAEYHTERLAVDYVQVTCGRCGLEGPKAPHTESGRLAWNEWAGQYGGDPYRKVELADCMPALIERAQRACQLDNGDPEPPTDEYCLGCSDAELCIAPHAIYAYRLWQRREDVGIRPEIAQFAIDMELKLMRNNAKGGWHGMDVGQLLRLLAKELDELADAIVHGSGQDVIDEAADVANYAMMIADLYRGGAKTDDE